MATTLEQAVAPLKAVRSLEQPAFDALLAASASLAAGAKGPDVLRSSAALDGVEGLEAAHQALAALFLHCARANVGSEELLAALSGALQPPRAQAVAEMLTRGGSTMRSAIEACGFGPPHIVDVSWERSAVVASKYQPDASGSLYVITLTIRRPDGTTAPLQFTATYEQLSDLVGELKSAVKQVERERAP